MSLTIEPNWILLRMECGRIVASFDPARAVLKIIYRKKEMLFDLAEISANESAKEDGDGQD